MPSPLAPRFPSTSACEELGETGRLGIVVVGNQPARDRDKKSDRLE